MKAVSKQQARDLLMHASAVFIDSYVAEVTRFGEGGDILIKLPTHSSAIELFEDSPQLFNVMPDGLHLMLLDLTAEDDDKCLFFIEESGIIIKQKGGIRYTITPLYSNNLRSIVVFGAPAKT